MMGIGSEFCKGFTSDANTEGAAQEAMNKKEEEDFNALADEANKEEPEKDPESVKLEEDFAAVKAEFEIANAELDELRIFKASIIEQQKLAEVDFALKEVEGIMPQEKVEEFRESSKNFSLEEIDAWKNALKAEAFNFSKDLPKEKTITKFSFPFATEKVEKDSIWKSLKSKNK
jgi:hypothetical protein